MKGKYKAFILRLSDEDFAKLNQKVELTRMEREKFMRMIIEGGKPSAAPSDELMVILRLFNKILLNIGQLWRLAESTNNPSAVIYENDYKRLNHLDVDFVCRRAKWKI